MTNGIGIGIDPDDPVLVLFVLFDIAFIFAMCILGPKIIFRLTHMEASVVGVCRELELEGISERRNCLTSSNCLPPTMCIFVLESLLLTLPTLLLLLLLLLLLVENCCVCVCR